MRADTELQIRGRVGPEAKTYCNKRRC